MRQVTAYEWTIEERTIYEDGTFDIENHDFADRLEQYPPNQWAEIDGQNFALTLIRRSFWPYRHEEAEAILGEDGFWVLPRKFADLDGNKTRNIPKRFHVELAKRQRQAKVPTK